jgi:predicted nucleotidyltransferase
MSAHPAPEEQVRIMNQETETFLEELKQKPEVLGVILFGSWARGNNIVRIAMLILLSF